VSNRFAKLVGTNAPTLIVEVSKTKNLKSIIVMQAALSQLLIGLLGEGSVDSALEFL
jgi:hypothetical protein